MNREEAIQVLQTALTSPLIYGEYRDAIGMAVEELKAPTGFISKQDVKWQIQEWINELNEAIDMLDSIPSAEAPTERTNTPNDLIRRQDAVKQFCNDCKGLDEPCEHHILCHTMKVLNSLPSAGQNCILCEYYTEIETDDGIKGKCTRRTGSDLISRQDAIEARRYTFGNDEFSLEAAYHDCKLVFDGITDDDSFQDADTGLVLYYANEIIYALHEALQGKDTNVPTKDCISRADAIDALGEEPPVWYDGEDEIAERNQWRRDKAAIESLPSADIEEDVARRIATIIENEQDMRVILKNAEPLVLTCDGCRHVGTYDTDFPCSGCIRREKDYYEQE